MVKCPRCGYENDTTDIYCRNCTYPLQDSNTYYGTKRKRNSSWNIGTGKKIILIVGIIVIAFLLFSIIYSMTQPSLESSLNVVTNNNTVLDSETNPYQVNITTSGSWEGRVGDGRYDNYINGVGNKLLKVSSPSWEDITVSITNDYSDTPLKVQLLKNGRVIAENTTSTPGKTITLNN